MLEGTSGQRTAIAVIFILLLSLRELESPMAARQTLDRWLGQLALAVSCSVLCGCGSKTVSTVLEYEVDQHAKPNAHAVKTDEIVAAMNGRLGKAGRARASGNGHVEVDVVGDVGAQELDAIKRRIASLGVLEFRILANRNDHEQEIKLAELSEADKVKIAGAPVARWMGLDPKRFLEESEREHWITRSAAGDGTEVLVMLDPYDVTGEHLAGLSLGSDSAGSPALDFTLNSQGTMRFNKLVAQPDHETGTPSQLGILLDGELLAASDLPGPITKEKKITGNFTKQEAETTVAILAASRLPYPIRLVSERQVAE